MSMRYLTTRVYFEKYLEHFGGADKGYGWFYYGVTEGKNITFILAPFTDKNETCPCPNWPILSKHFESGNKIKILFHFALKGEL